MNKNYIWIAIAAIVVIAGATLLYQNRPDSQVASEKESSDAMKEDQKLSNEVMMGKNDDSMMKEDNAMMSDDKMMSESHGRYEDHSTAKVSAEQKAGNKVVLFFHAPWCPFCKTAEAAFKANLDKIPEGVVVLKTDYDSNTELKKRYGVTYQHTFVQIDNNGDQVSKWTGGDIDNLIKYLK